jgi:uncharacterized RDD family membrane protein YckC
MQMPTGYDLLEHSHEFRIHMLRRLVAALIDAVLIFIPIMIIIYIIDIEPKELLVGILSGFFWFFYSAVFESRNGSTIGKKVIGLVVVSVDGPMTISKGVVRNVPKMFWYIFLIVDFFVGLGIKGDPRQRWVDTVSKTTVISLVDGIKKK